MALRQPSSDTGISRFRPDPEARRRLRSISPASRTALPDFPSRPAKRLSELAAAIGAPCPLDPLITGIASDSRRVRPGDLFIAASAELSRLSDFIAEACQRGAAAIVAPQPVAGVPWLEVADPRGALPQLAAAFHDYPAEQLRLIGITGTLGKTSTTLLLGHIFEAERWPVGIVGSLGIRLAEATQDTGITTPDASILHEALRWFADQGVGHVAMEVTSHALSQRRIDGLRFCLGVLTNLVADEHLEYHPSPEHYLDTKMGFVDFLQPGAPLIINADCALSRTRTRHLSGPVIGVSSRGEASAAVRIEDVRVTDGASEFVMRSARRSMALRLPLLGLTQVTNATMAATAALLLGASPEAVRRGLASAHPIPRRMELVRASSPLVIDDTVGNPASLEAVFETLRHIPHHGRLRVLFAIRGMRGADVNARLAATLAECIRPYRARLVVTSSVDFANARNTVLPAERDAFMASFEARADGRPFDFQPSLRDAVKTLLDDVGEADVVLLLGAQSLDAAAPLVIEHLK